MLAIDAPSAKFDDVFCILACLRGAVYLALEYLARSLICSVGATLVRRLLDHGIRDPALLRPQDNNEALGGLDVERVYAFHYIRDAIKRPRG